MDLAEPGVGDFVLLSEVSEAAFMDNLEKRFSKDRIYVRRRCRALCSAWAGLTPSPPAHWVDQTFIGNVVVSMNPYKKVNMYTPELIAQYRSGSMYELPPHVYACCPAA
jgi:myosin I